MVNWDWEVRPTYESERVKIDASCTPLVLYDMRLPRQITDHEISLMLSLAEHHLDRDLPMVGLVRHQRGTGVISARHRKAFADWIEERRGELNRDDFAVAVVMPEAIFRAVLRVVYRFRTPPLRTVTTPDVAGAAEAARTELRSMGQPVTPVIEAFLEGLTR